MILMLFLDSYITKIFVTIGFKYNTSQAKSYIVRAFVATLLLMGFSLLAYTILAFPPHVTWTENAANKCNVETDVGKAYTFLNIGWIFHILAVVFGSNITDHIRRHGLISKYWWTTGLVKSMLRAILSAGISIGIFLGFY